MKAKHDYVATALSIKTTKRVVIAAAIGAAVVASTVPPHSSTSAMKMRHDTNGLYREGVTTK